jgi:hypothetical protein
MPSKATFGKPHHSTSGIPEVVAQWIVGATLLLGLYIVFRVWLSLKNEPKNPPKKIRQKEAIMKQTKTKSTIRKQRLPSELCQRKVCSGRHPNRKTTT